MGQGHTIEYSFGTLLKRKTGILFDVNEKKRYLMSRSGIALLTIRIQN
jgi:hypothetical protein